MSIARDLKSQNFPGGRLLRAKTFRTECVNRFFNKCVIKCVNRFRDISINMFPDHLESFQTIWKVSKPSGKFSDHLESFQTIWKVSRPFGKFPDHLESFLAIWGKNTLHHFLFGMWDLCGILFVVRFYVG